MLPTTVHAPHPDALGESLFVDLFSNLLGIEWGRKPCISVDETGASPCLDGLFHLREVTHSQAEKLRVLVSPGRSALVPVCQLL